ncbi:MAG: hypothetical protein SPK78_06680, partial [Eubacteriales bacterium]|nr:hypothetical protein [Christensenellaceae bacterium]MDY5719160.1 hypothetical protein [Eubacteriales bacterium]
CSEIAKMGDAMAFPWFLYIVNPSVNPPYGDCQLPVRGAFLYSTIKLLHPLPYICVTCVTIVETG